MKKCGHFFLPVVSFYIFCTQAAIAQTPAIQWAKCYGGAGAEQTQSIQQTSDGGYIVAGASTSTDGQVSGNHGNFDVWIVKLNSTGGIVWEKSYGGTDFDNPYYIKQTTDGGYIIAATTKSTDGDVTGYHAGYDAWIIKLDDTGHLEWQKCLGGSGNEFAYAVQQTYNGGYIVTGYTTSTDGDISFSHGGADAWLIYLSPVGSVIWKKTFGGSGTDIARDVQQTADSNFIIIGNTTSNNADVSGNHGMQDVWVVKIDIDGNLIWQRCLGGTNDEEGNSIKQTVDGGFIATGSAMSADGDLKTNYGQKDVWVVKLTATGNITWQKTYGGSNYDRGFSLGSTIDKGYIVTCYTVSDNHDVTNYIGNTDYWTIKINDTGLLEWQKCMGGSNADYSYSVQQTIDSGYIIAGFSESHDSEVVGNHDTGFGGAGDIWIVKLDKDIPTGLVSSHTNNNILVYPTLSDNYIVIDKAQGYSYLITDITGRIVNYGQINSSKQQIDIGNFRQGVYLLQLINDSGEKQFIKFVKQ